MFKWPKRSHKSVKINIKELERQIYFYFSLHSFFNFFFREFSATFSSRNSLEKGQNESFNTESSENNYQRLRNKRRVSKSFMARFAREKLLAKETRKLLRF